LRPRLEADHGEGRLDPLPHHVAQAGVERLAVIRVGRLDVPEIVRIVGPDAEAVVSPLFLLVPVIDPPGGEPDVLVAQESRGRIVEVEAGQGVLLARRAAVREDQADLAFREDVLGDPGREKILAADGDAGGGLERARPDVEDGQIGVADLAVELGPIIDGDLGAVAKETDPAAEERREADARAEAEDLGALKEEHPLLRKKSGNRVRLMRRSSASVSAKSML